MIELTQENAEEVLQHSGLQVITFYSPSCAHCKRTESGIAELEAENAVSAEFVKCNVAEEASLSERFDVTMLPTLVFLKDGELKNKLTGFTHKLVIADQLSRI